jgi:hypothetical protein
VFCRTVEATQTTQLPLKGSDAGCFAPLRTLLPQLLTVLKANCRITVP